MTEILKTPIKSLSDKNNYRMIKLPNGLKFLLIQHPKQEDEKSQKLAGLCLLIDVGGYDDPVEAKGLSHFLEHMLFMGSQKYPKENEYDTYIKSNGGELNAYTEFSQTAYYFTSADSALEGAVDRFSSIFLSPLLSESSIERELQAVESEFQNNKNTNDTKIENLTYNAIDPVNPASVFILGNIATLRGDDRTNADLYELLYNHFNKYYVANRMSGAIQSSSDLDDLQIMVEKYFGDIKTGLVREETAYDMYRNIFDVKKFNSVTYIKPQTDERKLIISIPLPPSNKNYKCKPFEYVVKFLKTKFENGLCSYLKRNFLITDLSILDSKDFGTKAISTLFKIRFNITEYGLKHIEEILKAFYSYLLLMKETPMEKHKEIYEMWKEISEQEFNFKAIKELSEFVYQCSTNTHLYDDFDVLRGEDVFIQFDENLIQNYIDLLNEGNFNITIMDYELDVDYNQVEKYAGAEYRIDEIPESYKKLWNEREIMDELKLPPKNEFICTNFDLFSQSENVETMKYPEKIFENSVAETWYKLDKDFNLPKARVQLRLISPFNSQSTFNIVLSHLYQKIMTRFLDEKLAPAIEAGLTFEIKINSKNNSLDIKLSGYNETIHKMVDIITKELLQFNQYINEGAVNNFVKSFKDERKNELLEGLFLENLSDYVTLVKHKHSYEIYREIENVKFEHLEKFVEEFFRKLRIVTLIQGNILRDEVMAISDTILSNIKAETIDDKSLIEEASFKIPEGRNILKLKSYLSNDVNSQIYEFYDLGERTLRKDCLVAMLVQIMDEPVFNILRTNEQLGYALSFTSKSTRKSTGVEFNINSQEDKNPASVVALRIQKFVKIDMENILMNLSDEDFAAHRESLINSVLKPYDTLEDEMKFNWKEITNEHYLFDRNEKKAEMYRNISKEDVKQFYNELFAVKKERNLTIQYVGNVNETAEDENGDDMSYKYITGKDNDEGEIITNIEDFKGSLERY